MAENIAFIAYWTRDNCAFVFWPILSKQNRKLNEPEVLISVSVDSENQFLTEAELLTRLKRNNLVYPDQIFENLRPLEIEANILKMNEVKSAEVFTEIGSDWKIELTLRNPALRGFSITEVRLLFGQRWRNNVALKLAYG